MPTPVTQPATTSDNGIILEFGITAGRDFGALVQPFSSPGGDDKRLSCTDAAQMAQVNLVPLLQAVLSSDAEVIFVEARSMVHALHLPARIDFTSGTFPGLRGAGLAQGQVAALVLMYCDNNAPGPHGKLQVGKAFIPGLCEADLTEDIVDPAVVTAAEAFEHQAAHGTGGGTATGQTWYRVGAARRTAGAPLPKVMSVDGINIVATQRRRLVRV